MRSHLPLTLGDTLEDNANRFGDQPAFIMDNQILTHGRLLQRAKKLASAIEQQGLRRQDRISILSMNSLPFAEVMAAGHWSGLIVSTVNFRLAPPEIAYIINDSSPQILFFEFQYLPVIEQLRSQLSSVERYVCIGGSTDWAIDYEVFIETGQDEGSSFQAKEEDIACLIYTSGTTGKPKGCILGQREMRVSAQCMSVETRSGPCDRILLVMPLFHIGALAMQMGVHFRGGCVVLHRQFDPTELLKSVTNDGITILHLAPTLVQMMLDHPAVTDTDFSSLHTLVYSAAAMPLPLLKRGMSMLGNVFVNLYGQTEVFSSGLLREQHRPEGSEKEKHWLTSVGQPFPNTRIRIVDDNGSDCPTGTAGEIIVQSVAMARGYWNNHPATLETFRDGWCHSGDVGIIDEDGMLYLVDRKKDVIISGGENIYSREVEDAVLTHPAIIECAVIGQADDKWGETVCAVVVFKPGMEASEEDIIDHVKTMIASYKKPRSVISVTDIPKMPTGKIDKKVLRQQMGG
ncbi:long-chain-fatty-acid--CoA ligase [Aestuariicella hydrocarbonica]|uniref:Long-chain-fatty-acid--CoA ligase n=1 Tax=Pseudomaricurvus hydrocarbonicus TaxID=1470433 RepID=A0A9E5MM93_9GAMM|nr:long-chain-fatty-acid--CoA ligase [Aestuariicella hydrocarbonica]NHO66653.1 long-chain-fatty-acid--CoA ligase [Aestuariicella hydrocarbonica]